LRKLYDAAVRAELRSVEGRTFEEWKEKVSDFGLDGARQALMVESERSLPPASKGGDYLRQLVLAVNALTQIAGIRCGVPGHSVARNCGAQGIAFEALDAIDPPVSEEAQDGE
jgi:hypothetical protein